MVTKKLSVKQVKEILKQYQIKKAAMIMLIISVIISSICYIICLYYLNFTELTSEISEIRLAILKTVKDVLLACTSIFGGTLLVNVLVEKTSKNQFLAEIMNNDVVASPVFYQSMDKDIQENMYSALEESLYFPTKVQKEIYDYARTMLGSMPTDYYYEECSYAVTCKVYSDYIEKHITRTFKVRSYDGQRKIKEFVVSNFHAKQVSGLESFDLRAFKIDGADFKHKVKQVSATSDQLDRQNNYDVSRKYIYKDLRLKAGQSVEIIIEYVSRTSIDDRSSTFRTTKPCRKFSLLYTLDESPDYRIAVDAFGFLDDANDSVNTDSHHDVNITFNNWIFDCDGVVVTLLDKV